MTKANKQADALECEQGFYLTLGELSYSFNITRDTILHILDEGIVTAKKSNEGEWLFDGEAMRLIRTVLRLNRDLGVNFAGAGLVLQLLKEIDRLEILLQQQTK